MKFDLLHDKADFGSKFDLQDSTIAKLESVPFEQYKGQNLVTLPCWNCGEATHWVDQRLNTYLCSEECFAAKWAEYEYCDKVRNPLLEVIGDTSKKQADLIPIYAKASELFAKGGKKAVDIDAIDQLIVDRWSTAAPAAIKSGAKKLQANNKPE